MLDPRRSLFAAAVIMSIAMLGSSLLRGRAAAIALAGVVALCVAILVIWSR
jgi:hypothetical protein